MSEGTKNPAHSKMLVKGLWLNLDTDMSNGAYYHKNGRCKYIKNTFALLCFLILRGNLVKIPNSFFASYRFEIGGLALTTHKIVTEGKQLPTVSLSKFNGSINFSTTILQNILHSKSYPDSAVHLDP